MIMLGIVHKLVLISNTKNILCVVHHFTWIVEPVKQTLIHENCYPLGR